MYSVFVCKPLRKTPRKTARDQRYYREIGPQSGVSPNACTTGITGHADALPQNYKWQRN